VTRKALTDEQRVAKNAYGKAWREANKERLRLWHLAYRQSPANKLLRSVYKRSPASRAKGRERDALRRRDPIFMAANKKRLSLPETKAKERARRQIPANLAQVKKLHGTHQWKAKQAEYLRNSRERLADSYIKRTLRGAGWVGKPSAELLELKRELVLTQRLLKEMKKGE